MVDRYLNCTVPGCGGVAVAKEADLRKKNTVYTCEKCGHKFTVSHANLEFGKNTFKLNDPNDPLRGGLK